MTTGSTARPRRRNRRGEGELLRAEILAAAKDLLAETGNEDAVSVRAVAERVGVTTPSIYLHFEDKHALISAVCSEVFADLDRVMNDAAAGVDDPFDALRARGLAYAEFALANPEHYRIVMMTPRPASDDDFDFDNAMASTTFANLVAAVAACRDVGFFAGDADVEQMAVALWAAAHGAVSLVIAKQHFTIDDGMALCDSVISASGLGLALMSHLPPGEENPHGAGIMAAMRSAALGG
jgi:AcrR family transcriptional regulator